MFAEVIVAVPVNYGMLSYKLNMEQLYTVEGRSPRQLWNALLQISIEEFKNALGRSPRQLWNALLLETVTRHPKPDKSQSPSIMECSPTLSASLET